MKKIVIIGANSFQNPLILKAKEMGYETHVFAWKDGSIGERTADYFYPISIVEKEAILEECRKIQPDAVATIASDLANITVQYLAEQLGLPHNSDNCIHISTNKFAMREAFAKHGVPTPGFVSVCEGDDYAAAVASMQFPMIVKPTDRSGSRGIMRVESLYIEGNEYSCECISYQGRHHVLAVTKKYTTGYPHFIETGHMEPPELSEIEMNRVKEFIPKALTALEIENGASHSEFKLDADGNVRIIEIGSRMGGDCIGSHLVYLSSGYDFVRMVIETALGQEPELTPAHEPMCAGIRFVFTKKDLDVLEEIKSKSPELLQMVSEMEPVGEHQVVDSGSRFGYYILAGKNQAEIKDWLER